MAERLATVSTAPVPEPVRHLAELAVEDHRLSWRLHSVVPDSAEVSVIAAAWRAGLPAPVLLPGDGRLNGSIETFVSSHRIRLWSRLASRPIPDCDSDPDMLLARQVPEKAVQRYMEAIRHDHTDSAAWAGLAMAAARTNGLDRQLWQRRPELVRAIYHELHNRGGEPLDPIVLAEWLAAG
jgi:hypothetical protein